MCWSALDEGSGAASRKLMGRQKTPPHFSRQGLRSIESSDFFTYERGFFDGRSGVFLPTTVF
jgi:hypothetical protein